MSAAVLTGVCPADDDADIFPAAVSWLRAHYKPNPKQMIATIQGLLDAVGVAEHRAEVAEQAAAIANNRLAHAEGRLKQAELHTQRLKTRLVELQLKSIEGGTGATDD